MIDWSSIALMVLALGAGALVKGATGIGLPVVAVPALAAFFGVPHTIAIMLLPILSTNAWQAWLHRDQAKVIPFMPIMIAAVVISIGVMIASANSIAGFVEKHPTIKVLALSFLILIGFTLVAEGFHVHVPKGYIYFAMAFSVMIELINMRIRGKSEEPTHLKRTFPGEDAVRRVGARARMRGGE